VAVLRGDLERWVTARVMPATVLGFDVVCAAPKSISLLCSGTRRRVPSTGRAGGHCGLDVGLRSLLGAAGDGVG